MYACMVCVHTCSASLPGCRSCSSLTSVGLLDSAIPNTNQPCAGFPRGTPVRKHTCLPPACQLPPRTCPEAPPWSCVQGGTQAGLFEYHSRTSESGGRGREQRVGQWQTPITGGRWLIPGSRTATTAARVPGGWQGDNHGAGRACHPQFKPTGERALWCVIRRAPLTRISHPGLLLPLDALICGAPHVAKRVAARRLWVLPSAAPVGCSCKCTWAPAWHDARGRGAGWFWKLGDTGCSCCVTGLCHVNHATCFRCASKPQGTSAESHGLLAL